MAASQPKLKKKAKVASPRKPVVRRKRESFAKPYDAKKFAGTVPAFAEITADEMKSWRDDR